MSYPEPLATRRVILNNNQREKTSGQKTREALVLEEVEREIGKENMSAGGEGLANLPNPNHDTREKIAEEVNVGEKTIQKGLDVYRIAYPDEYVHDDLQNPV